MKKKFGVLFLLAFSAFLLCSCGAEPQGEETASTALQTTQSFSEASASAYETLPQTTPSQESAPASTAESVQTTSAVTVTVSSTAGTTKKAASTEPESTAAKATEPQKDTCLLTVDCRNLLKNADLLKKSKRRFVPKNGYILKAVPVEIGEGETAFDVLKRGCVENVCTDSCEFCKKGGVQLEFSFTPAYQSYYVEGIHQLYEKDCGTLSGWMYSVNGKYPDVSSSAYEVKPGDEITFAYTVSMGDDL